MAALDLLQRRVDELIALAAILGPQAIQALEPADLLVAVADGGFDASSQAHLTNAAIRLSVALLLAAADVAVASTDKRQGLLHLLLPPDYPAAAAARVEAVTCAALGREAEGRCAAALQALADEAAAAPGGGQECLYPLADAAMQHLQAALAELYRQQQAADASQAGGAQPAAQPSSGGAAAAAAAGGAVARAQRAAPSWRSSAWTTCTPAPPTRAPCAAGRASWASAAACCSAAGAETAPPGAAAGAAAAAAVAADGPRPSSCSCWRALLGMSRTFWCGFALATWMLTPRAEQEATVPELAALLRRCGLAELWGAATGLPNSLPEA
ncbi:hypothetical protein ABPG75_000345 [Micractinium tetrahymenae]